MPATPLPLPLPSALLSSPLSAAFAVIYCILLGGFCCFVQQFFAILFRPFFVRLSLVLSTFYFICISCAANWLGKLHGLKRFLVCSVCLRVCERLCSWFTVCCDLKVLRRSCPQIKLSFHGQSRAKKKTKSNRKLMKKHAKSGCALWNRLPKLVKGW